MKKTLLDVAEQDITVFSILNAGGTAEDCVVALFTEKEALKTRIDQLQNIAPRKLKLSDGRVFVWHCPDDLIPEVTL